MKTVTVLRAGLAGLVLAFAGGNGYASGMDAESIVRAELRARGLHAGYNERNGLVVGVETEYAEVPAGIAALEKRRALSFFLVEDAARSSIMRTRSFEAQARAGTAGVSGNGAGGQGTAVDVTVKSGEFVYGCDICALAETVEDGVLATSIALYWSPADEKAARRSLSANPGGLPPPEDAIHPSPEWKRWAEQQDFGKTLGFRSFRDSRGIWRFAGIGTVDVEEKTGIALAAAMRLAKEKATAHLAYALFGRVETTRRLQERFDEREDSKTGSTRLETMISEQMAKSAHIVIPATEVYTTTVVHPLTGRKLFVSIVGMEPRDLAELKLLGGGNADGDGSRTTRPDHDWRPASNRPDHSVRPASLRPVHP